MTDSQEFHKPNQSIAQLKELQFARRISFLEDQKNHRKEQHSFLQDLKKVAPHLKLTKKQQKYEKQLKREFEPLPKSTPKEPSVPVKPTYNYNFKNILMLSEWMMAVPENLEDYLLIPCPKGIRVVASVEDTPGFTSLYLKSGQHILDFKTNLPPNTILDCIYSKSDKTVYILDLLMYSSRDVTNCDTSFRRFWLKSKFVEDEIRSHDPNAKLKVILDFDFSNAHSVYECFQKHPMFEDGGRLDGFLFYHKESIYTFGETPLVLWLFPFMIDEVLTMFRVNPIYNSQRPLNYKNYLEYIEEFNENMKKKKRKRVKGEKKVEVKEKKEERKEDFSEDVEVDEMQRMIELEKHGGDV